MAPRFVPTHNGRGVRNTHTGGIFNTMNQALREAAEQIAMATHPYSTAKRQQAMPNILKGLQNNLRRNYTIKNIAGRNIPVPFLFQVGPFTQEVNPLLIKLQKERTAISSDVKKLQEMFNYGKIDDYIALYYQIDKLYNEIRNTMIELSNVYKRYGLPPDTIEYDVDRLNKEMVVLRKASQEVKVAYNAREAAAQAKKNANNAARRRAAEQAKKNANNAARRRAAAQAKKPGGFTNENRRTANRQAAANLRAAAAAAARVAKEEANKEQKRKEKGKGPESNETKRAREAAAATKQAANKAEKAARAASRASAANEANRREREARARAQGAGPSGAGPSGAAAANRERKKNLLAEVQKRMNTNARIRNAQIQRNKNASKMTNEQKRIVGQQRLSNQNLRNMLAAMNKEGLSNKPIYKVTKSLIKLRENAAKQAANKAASNIERNQWNNRLTAVRRGRSNLQTVKNLFQNAFGVTVTPGKRSEVLKLLRDYHPDKVPNKNKAKATVLTRIVTNITSKMS